MSSTSDLQPFSPSSSAAPDWRRALGGIWRLTYPRFLAPTNLAILAGLLGVLALLAWSGVREGNAQHFASWSINFYLAFLVPALAFLASAGLVRDDLKPDTVDYVLTRPIRRHVFVLGRYLAHTACLQAQCLLALAVLVAVGVFRHVPGLSSAVPSMLLAQLLAVNAFGALGFAFGAMTGRYLILGILYAAIVEIGIGHIPTQLSHLSMLHHVRVIAGNGLRPSDQSLPASIFALLLFSLVLAAVSAALFSLKEPAASSAKDS